MPSAPHYSALGMVISLVILSGCGYDLTSIKMNSAQQVPANFTETKDGVTVRVTWFDSIKKGKRLLGDAVEKIMTGSKAVFPVYISIVNHSDHSWVLKPGCIGLKFVDPEQIRHRLSESAGGKFLAILGAGVAVATSLGIAGVSLLHDHTSGSRALGCGLLALGEASLYSAASIGAIEAIHTAEHNARVREEIDDKVFDDAIVIHPGYSFQTVFFCPQATFSPDFTISLLKEGRCADMMTYCVDLCPQVSASHAVQVLEAPSPAHRVESSKTVVTVRRTVFVR